jgi:hypothetical protein
VSSHGHRDAARPDGLTDFQIEIARLFFALPSSAGFILASPCSCACATIAAASCS